MVIHGVFHVIMLLKQESLPRTGSLRKTLENQTQKGQNIRVNSRTGPEPPENYSQFRNWTRKHQIFELVLEPETQIPKLNQV